MPNQTYNLYINSRNRISTDKTYDFNLFLQNQILINKNQGINVNVMSFSMINSMYNVNEKNNTFNLEQRTLTDTFISTFIITIPNGNYNVITFRDTLNNLLSNKINVSYNKATNTYTYKNIDTGSKYYLQSLTKCSKLLGLKEDIEVSISGITGTYIDMVNYQQVILRCPSLQFEDLTQDNINDTDNTLNVSDILFWINKQDIEPFKTINYNNEDACTSYSFNIKNENIRMLNFRLYNEKNEVIEDAGEFLLQLKINVYDKDDNFYKDISTKIYKILDDIYFLLLNAFFRKK